MDTVLRNKFDSYPEEARKRLLEIRELIIKTAEHNGIGELKETLKWGEPSYVASKGSTIRIDWKLRSPDKVSIYFNCKTTLVETFKQLYGVRLQTMGNREIKLPLSGSIPIPEIRACISMALRYHSIKHLPLLGE